MALQNYGLHKWLCEGKAVNIGEQMFIMVLNMITSMLWGGAVTGTKWVKEGAELRREVINAVNLLATRNLADFFPWLTRFDLQGVAKKMRDSTKRLDAMITAIIDERKQVNERNNGYDNKDFLKFLLELNDRGNAKSQLTMDQLKGLLIKLGHNFPQLVHKCVFPGHHCFKDRYKLQHNRLCHVREHNKVEESHIPQLPYLQAIMKETLRLHPILPLLVPRSSNRECVVGGYMIPKGTASFVNIWAIHRDPLHWEDPIEFKPERFLDKKHEFCGNDCSYFPFGWGRRICVGIPIAERIIMSSIASLLHCFDWKLPNGVMELDLKVKFGFTLKKTMPLLLIPSRRLQNLGGDQSSI
ncbi:hypothetical protein V2J09_010345 [Rumex salicifolius]